jgi:hypothetical protein
VVAQIHFGYKKAEFDTDLEFVGKVKENSCKKVSSEKAIKN